MRFPTCLPGAGRALPVLLALSGLVPPLVSPARCAEGGEGIIRMDGAASVASSISGAVQALRAEEGMDINIAASRGSAGGIGAVGAGEADVGMSSRAISPTDRAAFPEISLQATYIGQLAVVLAVSKDVADGGVKALSPAQARAIYEGKAANWKEFGGPDAQIKFYNPSPGRGVWEMFTEWVYGDNRRAPLKTAAELVRSNEEARNALDFVRGALTVLPLQSLKGAEARPLALAGAKDAQGEPTLKNAVAGKYIMSRPMFLVTKDRPVGQVKKLVDFILSERGQGLLAKQGCITVQEAREAGGNEFAPAN